jgi:hypothetical protein
MKNPTETLLIAILEAHEPVSALRENSFTPWIDSDPAHREMTVNIAAHKALRVRGGLLPGESWEIKVYAAPATARKTAKGLPAEVTYHHFKFTHN